MITDDWQTSSTSSALLPTSETILSQALPGVLATPSGWHSEVIGSSSSSFSESATNLISDNSTSTNFFEKHEEYKTLNAIDAPPIIFSSSNNETNRLINEIPSSSILPSTTISSSSSSSNEYNNATICDSTIQNQKVFLKHDQQEPLVIRKTLPNNTIKYEQNVSVRYLQPPSPPPPGPIIIREVRQPPLPPPSPIKIRQRPPPAPTPPPMVFRERPPPAPPRLPSQVVEKILPPPPRQPRRLIVERYAGCPPKPSDVVIERWLPYPRTDRRRILFERAPAPYLPPREPNLLILHDQPHARIHKEFINQGVARADPHIYLQQYGAEINSSGASSRYAHLIHEADHALPPPHPLSSPGAHHGYHSPYPNAHPSSLVSSMWDRMKSVSPLPHTMSHSSIYPSHPPPYHHADYSQSHSPYPPHPSYPPYHPPYSHADYSQSYSPYPPHPSYPPYHPPYHHSDYPRSHSPYDPHPSYPPYNSSYHHTGYSRSHSPYDPHPSYPSYNSRCHSPINYHGSTSYIGDHQTMVDVTPSWGRTCYSRIPSYDYSSSYPSRSIHSNTADDLHHSFSRLKTTYPSASFNSY